MDTPQPARRRFLKTLAVAAAATPFAAAWPLPGHARADATAARRAGLRHFPQSLASGDPRPDRVLLWTRAPAVDGGDVAVRLQVADDPGFARLRVERELLAEAAADHCLRVRVTGLAPGRAYHYRFLRQVDGEWIGSPPGLTRTAPAGDVAAPARFAVLSCQDYGGRWYNSLLPLLEDTPDFLLHLGDFIYETVGDPRFQSGDGARAIRFDDVAGALVMGEGASRFLAARSLDNYRQLHRTFRGDDVLQRLLERAPLVAIWDDHEFSDDCWGERATYLDGRRDEADRQRRRHAEQAYFEYMPVDVEIGAIDANGQSRIDTARLYPRTELWRELRWGRDVQLLLTDYRSHRPDHAIPEDAFPGALVHDADAIARLLPASGFDPRLAGAQLLPYLDLDEERWRPLKTPLKRALNRGYRDAGLDRREAARRAAAAARGKIALHVLREVLARYNAAVPRLLRVEPPPVEGEYPRGLPWLALGKTTLFGEVGSRYLVVKDAFDLLQALRAAESPVPSAYGKAQAAWLGAAIARPAPRWRLLANSVTMAPMVLDLADPALGAPALMRRKFYLNIDQWDGFGRERDGWIEALDAGGGAVVFSGDIHAGFVTRLGRRTLEFTTPAVSSTPLYDMLLTSARRDPANAEAGTRLAEHLERLLRQGEARIEHVQTRRHGHLRVEIAGDLLRARFVELPSAVCRERRYDDPAGVRGQTRETAFVIDARDYRLRRA
ncbi:alkaline phosphatase D family protein [Solilutibacter pythonis]|uniref:alkaline phosphatase D family protein n=1 Tax=Solilutibacter pythonis TaxID=2483112 RepID=UPI001314E4F2|nr:alkaline phosphatase D family protein [Lysobacter pythonis]